MFSATKNHADPSLPSDAPAAPTWAFALIIFLSAFLLFQVQPILAKLVLPWFGGAAAVWTVSLAFYQSTYLLGNLYAHWLIQRGGRRFSARLHAALLLASLLLLPIIPKSVWQPQGAEEPVWRILGLLAATVGLPFLLLSATSPLLQSWHSRNRLGAQPYRFYALSNAGSLLALLSYPVVVEPLLSTHRQAFIWSGAYVAFAILCAAIAYRELPGTPEQQLALDNKRPGWKLQIVWLALAATASALLLSVTHHLSLNIAAVPLLWIVPLSLYLLTLILCFEGRRWYHRSLFLRLLPVALGAMAYALAPEFENARPSLQIPLYCAGLYICCMVCHGEMAALKPEARFLTHFYLMVSAGGALGGIFVALLAPRVFRGFYELPLSLGACAIAVLIALLCEPQGSPARLGRPAFLAATVSAALLLALLIHVIELQSRQAQVMVRNFYGMLRVNVVPSGPVRPSVTQLRNGTIVHGEEILGERSDVPTTYYGEHSGIGIALLFSRQRGNIRVGVVGLGVGTLARYGQEGDQYSFYEINPLDIDLAKNLFDFLGRADAQVDIIRGDGRLSLERQPSQQLDVLVVDAFSGDAIPVHLLTREAFQLYFQRLRPNGLLAIHVSNKFLDLPPVVEAGARAVGARAVKVTNAGDEANAVYESTWMLVDRIASPNPTVAGLIESKMSLPPGTSSQIEKNLGPLWTDDYSNLLQIMK